MVTLPCRGANMFACPGDAVAELIQSYQDRGWDDLLTWMPCQMFDLIRGRTIWLLGDSQNGYFYRWVA